MHLLTSCQLIFMLELDAPIIRRLKYEDQSSACKLVLQNMVYHEPQIPKMEKNELSVCTSVIYSFNAMIFIAFSLI